MKPGYIVSGIIILYYIILYSGIHRFLVYTCWYIWGWAEKFIDWKVNMMMFHFTQNTPFCRYGLTLLQGIGSIFKALPTRYAKEIRKLMYQLIVQRGTFSNRIILVLWHFNLCSLLMSNPFLYISYLPTPLLGQDMTQGQFLSGV